MEQIPGVGEKTIELLLQKLKSVKRIKESSLETLEEISVEGKEQFMHGGGEVYNYIPCLNDEDRWIDVVKILCEEKLNEFYLI